MKQYAMNANLRSSIWFMALGYFVFYIPYSAMTKALSRGILPGTDGPISGFELLPVVVIGTFVALTVILYTTGWINHAKQRNIAGLNIPVPSNQWTIYSGIATAFIIMTTTLAYSFTGISIVFAALLMRGGVLLLAPGIDLIYKRKVHWYSVVALCLSLCALVVLFSEKGGYNLSLIAFLNIAFYLGGYFFRLQFMTLVAKDNEKDTNYKFFVEEMLVAMAAIIVIPAFLALLNIGTIMGDLNAGFSSLLFSKLALPALGIGALYGCLYIFGTRIYLNKRENTFCIPINRCASLLAGVVASLLLSVLIGGSFVSSIQLISASILVVAIFFLAYPSFSSVFGKATQPTNLNPQLQYLFVCPGNTGRSPMAQAICKNLIFNRLANPGDNMSNYNIISAGISPRVGNPISVHAKDVLTNLGIKVEDHSASIIEREVIRSSNKIFCMSEKHRAILVKKFPSAALKTICLDPEDNIPVPHSSGIKTYEHCANRLKELIDDSILTGQIRVAE